ncbi:MAG: thiolase family protein [Aeropyrum sp.]|nr:thiolase family protein [Aeropyrum sp.]
MSVSVKSASMVRVGRHYKVGVDDMVVEVADEALSDAGWRKPDAIVVSSVVYPRLSGQSDLASYVASSLGFQGVSAVAVEAGEASGLAAAMTAARLAAEGRRVLLVGVDKLSDAPSSVIYKVLKGVYHMGSDGWYMISHSAIPGLLADLYMSSYGVDRNTLSYWPALMHSHAKLNPYAMLRFAVNPEAVASAMPVAKPLTMLDSFPLGDGAAAITLAPAGDGGGIATLAAVESAVGPMTVAHADDPLDMPAVRAAWGKVKSATGVNSVDVMEIHDSYTIMAMLILEALGLSERGKAAEQVALGKFSQGGEGPLANPSGGLKARGHPVGATGVYMLAELALQLAGSFPGVRVDGARSGLAVGINAHGSTAYSALLVSSN